MPPSSSNCCVERPSRVMGSLSCWKGSRRLSARIPSLSRRISWSREAKRLAEGQHSPWGHESHSRSRPAGPGRRSHTHSAQRPRASAAGVPRAACSYSRSRRREQPPGQTAAEDRIPKAQKGAHRPKVTSRSWQSPSHGPRLHPKRPSQAQRVLATAGGRLMMPASTGSAEKAPQPADSAAGDDSFLTAAEDRLGFWWLGQLTQLGTSLMGPGGGLARKCLLSRLGDQGLCPHAGELGSRARPGTQTGRPGGEGAGGSSATLPRPASAEGRLVSAGRRGRAARSRGRGAPGWGGTQSRGGGSPG